MNYKTIEGSAEDRFIEKKSEFIGYLRHTATEREALDFIAEIRAMHRKATHNCYAYILRENNLSRHSDDGEPGGTAGVPIYEVLRKEGLTDVTCVVTRYFGGVLLGAGGLVRAYSHTSKIALEAGNIITMAKCSVLRITVPYNQYDRMNKLLTDFGANIINTDFSDNVIIEFSVRQTKEDEIKALITDNTNGTIETEFIRNEFLKAS